MCRMSGVPPRATLVSGQDGTHPHLITAPGRRRSYPAVKGLWYRWSPRLEGLLV